MPEPFEPDQPPEIGPVDTLVMIGTAVDVTGEKYVTLSWATPLGTHTYWIRAKNAVAVGDAIREAAVDLAIVRNVGGLS